MSEPQTDDGTDPQVGASRLRAVRAGSRIGYVASSTLADLVLDRQHNPVRAWHIINYVSLWGVHVELFGRPPRSIRELAEWAPQSTATLSRWSRVFAAAFPEYDSPGVLWSMVRPQLVEHAQADDADSVSMRIGAAIL